MQSIGGRNDGASERRLMDVVGSRRNAQVRVPPAILVVAAVVVIGALVYVTGSSTGSGPSHPSVSSTADRSAHARSGSSPPGRAGSSSETAETTGFYLKSSVPTAGAQAVPSNTTITLTFSEPIDLKKAAPVLNPKIGGTWVRSSPTTLAYHLASPFVPSTEETVTLPDGPSGLRAANGSTLSVRASFTFSVGAGDTLRVQELLAGLDYLPLTYTQTGPAPAVANLALDQPGAFAWRWPDQPLQLMSLWTQGTTNEITKAAVEAFENDNNLGVDGEVGPAVWTALINDTINHKTDPVPYVYVVVNKVVPQNLTVYENGAAKYVGIPVNSGARGADTTDGTFAVFEHVRYSDMKGTNPDGSTYDDPNVPYASYFNGGDALHGFIRSSYGTPQSNGCVEMSYANAALVWALTPIGTLVTVEGPDFGTAPPPTTTTTTAAPTTTTVASPSPPPPTPPTTVPVPPPTPPTTVPAPPPAAGVETSPTAGT
jgi:lipoprotein-anchoring transpeptidase ErfK/SrfK